MGLGTEQPTVPGTPCSWGSGSTWISQESVETHTANRTGNQTANGTGTRQLMGPGTGLGTRRATGPGTPRRRSQDRMGTGRDPESQQNSNQPADGTGARRLMGPGTRQATGQEQDRELLAARAGTAWEPANIQTSNGTMFTRATGTKNGLSGPMQWSQKRPTL